MGIVKGGFLRILQTALYFITFCCAAIVLGIYSYFLAVQADRSFSIPTWQKAVEGLSGAATLYTIFAVILTCCLGGVRVFSILGFILDILFAAAFVAIAVMTRDGASRCSGYVNTPLGSGDADNSAAGFGGGSADGDQNFTYAVRYFTACRLNTAAFAVSIVAIIFFIITAFMQLGLIRSHGREKRYGPGPSNNYTSGYGKRKFWQRKPKNTMHKDAELGPTGTAVDSQPCVDKSIKHTATTAAAPTTTTTTTTATHGTHSGYHTQPQGTGVNPYGYDNTTAPNTYSTGTATNY